MKNAVKVSQEKSTSWLITGEAVILAGILGFYLISQEAHPALALAIGAGVAVLIRQAIVYVEAIFWVWSVGLGLVAAYFAYSWVISDSGDTGWAVFWGAVAVIVVVGAHTQSREHNQVEDTPNEIKRIIK